ncbi:MAG TPA: hypothetical protein VIM58_08030, partial [Candidatus Methylacidiphilales bacterium]
MRILLSRAFRSASAWSLAAAALRAGALVFVLPLMVRLLPPEELGLWYVFLSVGALAGLLDFGFNPTMGRAVAYVWGGAPELRALGLAEPAASPAAGVPPGSEPEPEPNRPLLARLVATMALYYRLLALAVLALMLTAGTWWIAGRTTGLP